STRSPARTPPSSTAWSISADHPLPHCGRGFCFPGRRFAGGAGRASGDRRGRLAGPRSPLDSTYPVPLNVAASVVSSYRLPREKPPVEGANRVLHCKGGPHVASFCLSVVRAPRIGRRFSESG